MAINSTTHRQLLSQQSLTALERVPLLMADEAFSPLARYISRQELVAGIPPGGDSQLHLLVAGPRLGMPSPSRSVSSAGASGETLFVNTCCRLERLMSTPLEQVQAGVAGNGLGY